MECIWKECRYLLSCFFFISCKVGSMCFHDVVPSLRLNDSWNIVSTLSRPTQSHASSHYGKTFCTYTANKTSTALSTVWYVVKAHSQKYRVAVFISECLDPFRFKCSLIVFVFEHLTIKTTQGFSCSVSGKTLGYITCFTKMKRLSFSLQKQEDRVEQMNTLIETTKVKVNSF